VLAEIEHAQRRKNAYGNNRHILTLGEGRQGFDLVHNLALRTQKGLVFEQTRTEVVFKIVFVEFKRQLRVIRKLEKCVIDVSRQTLAIDNVQLQLSPQTGRPLTKARAGQLLA
jgi:hypothetical protein